MLLLSAETSFWGKASPASCRTGQVTAKFLWCCVSIGVLEKYGEIYDLMALHQTLFNLQYKKKLLLMQNVIVASVFIID